MSYFHMYTSSYWISWDKLHIILNLLFFQKQFSLGLYVAKFIFFGLLLDFESSKAQLKLIHPNTTPNWTVIGLEYFVRDVERKLKNDQRNEA